MSIVMSRVASPRGPSRRPANRSIAAALVGVSLLSAPLACSSTSDFPATRSSTDAAQQTLAPDDDTSSGDAPTDSGSVPVADVDTSSVDTSSVDTSSVDTSSVDTESPATPDADTDLTIDPEPDLTPPNIVERSIEFPVVVSDDRNAILDSDGRPLLFTGDAAWSMIVQLDDDEAADYLQIRRDMGFDTLLVNLIEHQFSDDPPNNPDGVPPFGSPGDFTDPIPAYFDHAHDLIALRA